MGDSVTVDRDDDTGSSGALPPRPWQTSAPSSGGPVAQVTELKDLVVAYAKQETVDPLKVLNRYLTFGISGALAIGVGLCFGLLGMLRGLQEIEIFNDGSATGGTWGFVPYLITFLVGAVISALFLHRLYRFTQKQGTAR